MFNNIDDKGKLPVKSGSFFEWSFYCQRESDDITFYLWFEKKGDRNWRLVYYEALKNVDGAYRTLNIRLSAKEKTEIESYFLYDCIKTRLRFSMYG